MCRRGSVGAVNSLREALDDLARVQPHLVDDARAAWMSLVDADSPEGLTQWRLQNYLWHTLVRDSSLDAARRWRIAVALGALLDGLGLERYGAIAYGTATREIVTCPDLARASGRALVRRALDRSGIEPPDTELLTWAPIAGAAEALARESVADRLELSVAVGDLVPGRRGWRDLQADITIAVLTTPSTRDGLIPYESILDERMDEWIRGPHSPTRNALLAPLAMLLREPVAPGLPAPARVLLRPLDWLLRQVDDGAVLAVETRGCSTAICTSTATRLGLLRRRGAGVTLTPSGRQALSDGRALWLAVASGIIGDDHSAFAVCAEVVLAVLEPGHWVPEGDARRMVQSVVTESGWRLAARREPAASDTRVLFDAVINDLRWLNLVEEAQSPQGRRIRARESAIDLFRAALRHRVLHRVVVPF